MTTVELLNKGAGLGTAERPWFAPGAKPIRTDQIDNGHSVDAFNAGLGIFDANASEHPNSSLWTIKESDSQVRGIVTHPHGLLVATVLVEPLEEHEQFDPDHNTYFVNEYLVRRSQSHEVVPREIAPESSAIVRVIVDLGNAALLQRPVHEAA